MPKTPHDQNNFILGRGRLSIAGRYIGNTPTMTFQWDGVANRVVLIFATTNISRENLDWFFNTTSESPTLKITYESNNPCGDEQSFDLGACVVVPVRFDVKTDDWQTLVFKAIPPRSILARLTRRSDPPVDQTN